MRLKNLLMYGFLLASLTLICTTAKANEQHAPPTTTAETVVTELVTTTTQSEAPEGETETENKLKSEAERKEDDDELVKKVGYDPKNREVILERVSEGEHTLYEVYKTATVKESYKQFLEAEIEKALDYYNFLLGCSQN